MNGYQFSKGRFDAYASKKFVAFIFALAVGLSCYLHWELKRQFNDVVNREMGGLEKHFEERMHLSEDFCDKKLNGNRNFYEEMQKINDDFSQKKWERQILLNDKTWQLQTEHFNNKIGILEKRVEDLEKLLKAKKDKEK